MFNEYKSAFREAYLKEGDASRAKAIALGRVTRFYGETNITGSKTVIKYPPEKFFPTNHVEILGGFLKDQTKKALKEYKKDGYKVVQGPFLVSDSHTQRTVEAWSRGDQVPEDVLERDGLAITKMVRVTPEWKVGVVLEKNGISETTYLGYFGKEGLLQAVHDNNQAAMEEVTKENEWYRRERIKSQNVKPEDTSILGIDRYQGLLNERKMDEEFEKRLREAR
jgi:hypothetical protein